MKTFLKSLAYALLIVAIGIIIGLMEERKSHAASPLSVYGCADLPSEWLGKSYVCKVYDPDMGRHFIVVVTDTQHGSAPAIFREEY